MDEEDGSIVYPLESDGPPEGGQWLRHAFPLSIPGLELAYFENIYYFSKVFKRVCGLSPSEWQKRQESD